MADIKGGADKVAREKILKLQIYVEGLKAKLAGGTFSPKHAKNPEVYRAWLVREIDQHTKKIENLRIKA